MTINQDTIPSQLDPVTIPSVLGPVGSSPRRSDPTDTMSPAVKWFLGAVALAVLLYLAF